MVVEDVVGGKERGKKVSGWGTGICSQPEGVVIWVVVEGPIREENQREQQSRRAPA
jgi:hypothetical protein